MKGDIEAETPLQGGRITSGVVRVGKTVRRPRSEASDYVAALLQYLERQGCIAVPRYLGTDEKGRDILEFIPGDVPRKFRRFDDHQIVAAAHLLRSLHDATRGSALTRHCAVVCHNDPGPNNVVFQGDRPRAFIDFDFAAPGAPIEDLAYMAWSWCISSKPERSPATEQADQVRILMDAYGASEPERRDLMAAVMDRQSQNAGFWIERSREPDGMNTSAEVMRERAAWSLQERDFVREHLELFDAVVRR